MSITQSFLINIRRLSQRCSFAILLLTLLLFSQANAQTVRPSFKDLAYDSQSPAERLDVYLPDSDTPVPAMIHIHGGGWRGGSKDYVPKFLLDLVESKQLAVISVEYRFTDVAIHPAQVNDCLRVVQFVRAHAQQWKIDPSRIGVTGGSAGGHLSLYVALHDDIADAASTDDVGKQSSRVACAISFAGPTDWSLLNQLIHVHPAYRQLIGYEPGTPVEKMDAAKMTDVSPISLVSRDDPPIMQVHGDADDIVPIQHAQNLDTKLKSAQVRSELVVIKGANHGVAGASPEVSKQASEFLRKTLTITK